jgi:hypothetical protein
MVAASCPNDDTHAQRDKRRQKALPLHRLHSEPFGRDGGGIDRDGQNGPAGRRRFFLDGRSHTTPGKPFKGTSISPR